ncbi:MAG: hypothetical protein ACRDNZ_00905 [Streptosporangiaceae bacterium]
MTVVSAMPRTRGGISGILLVLLGAWGAIIPFVGPYMGYAYTPNTTWTYTNGRLWLSILPGVATMLGGIMVLLSARRIPAISGASLAALSGAWFVVGAPILAATVGIGANGPGIPVISGSGFGVPVTVLLEGLGFYYGIGVVIVFFAALALGRFAVGTAQAAKYAAPPKAAEPADRERRYRAA